ncbi:MAG TPA: hypothetical protein VF775_01835 [Geobacteraceae bacterium]
MMKYMQKIAPFLVLVAMSGCAALPPAGPSVTVLPAQGKSFDTFRAEDATCRQWAEQRLGAPTQEAYQQNVATGAVAGTAIGAGLGAAVGSASGHAGAGALVGAAGGLLAGTAIGAGTGEAYGAEAQHRYDNAYVQCMYSYGNQVPGYRRVASTAPPVVAAPVQPPAVSPEPEDYPPPPEVYLDDAPRFIYAPAIGMYVAVGVPFDLVYTGRDYFYFYGGRWYRGPYYNGPWSFVPRRSYPPAFRRYRVNYIRQYRDVEFGRYEHDREHYDGRFHRPEFRGGMRRMEH